MAVLKRNGLEHLWMQVVQKIENAISNINYKDVGAAPDQHEHSYLGIETINYNLPEGTWRDIAYGNGVYVAIGDGLKVAYSYDCVTWNIVDVSGLLNNLDTVSTALYVVWGNDRFVIQIYYSDQILYSSDGIEWHAASLPSFEYWHGIAYGNGRFVVVSHGSMGSKVAAYSDDAITWTPTVLSTSALWSQMTFGNGTFVAAATNLGYINYSTDNGVTWNASNLPDECYCANIAFGNGVFVAIDHSSGNTGVYSNDGSNWTKVELPVSAKWEFILYNGNKFLAASSDAHFIYSSDGITWIEGSVLNFAWRNGTSDNHKTWMISENGVISNSEDGVEWAIETPFLMQDHEDSSQTLKAIIGNPYQYGTTLPETASEGELFFLLNS